VIHMVAKTTAERVKEQRRLRIAEGWVEVRVWVTSEEDAVAVRKMADQCRAKAAALPGLEEVSKTMNIVTMQRTIQAIREQGSPAYITPSGAVLTLLTELASEGDLQGLSKAFAIFAHAKPGNVAIVAKSVPAKVLNSYWLGHLKLNNSATFNWTQKNPDWAEWVTDALRNPSRFEHLVNAFADEIMALEKSKH